MHNTDQALINSALKVLEIEASALQHISRQLDDSFVKACRAIMECTDPDGQRKGRVIVIGIGKSGHVASKIAATFASTGTPAFFVHPAEAAHGDLGMITKDDLAIFITKSGETQEILTFMPLLKRLGIPLISITGKRNSTISNMSDITLDIGIPQEACSLGLAPTASTTAAIAMGDALAVSILQARGFNEDDFARSHPGGMLGRRLLVKISDIMHSDDNLPKVSPSTLLRDAMLEISEKRLGMTTVVDGQNKIIGVCTDGDLRRAFSKNIDLQTTLISEIMTVNFRTVFADMLATEAVHLMQEHKISALPVLNRDNELVGAFNIHDVFRAGVV